MIDDEIRRLVDERMDETMDKRIYQRLVEIGVDTSTPEKKIELQKNFAHLSKVRQDDEKTHREFRRSTIQQLVAGLAAFVLREKR